MSRSVDWHFWLINANAQFTLTHLRRGGIHHLSVVIYDLFFKLNCLLNLMYKPIIQKREVS